MTIFTLEEYNIIGFKTYSEASDRYVFEYDEDGVLVRMVDNSNDTAIIYSEDGGMSIIDNAKERHLYILLVFAVKREGGNSL